MTDFSLKKLTTKEIFTSKNILTFFLLLIIFVSFFYFWQRKVPKEKIPYSEVYRLVPEKVSQSAPIKITLPAGVDREYAKNNIKFLPEIKGNWKEEKFSFLDNFVFAVSEEEREIVFQPREKLNLNTYYAVQLTLPDGGIMEEDFLVVEDPRVIAIFPQENSEAPENSEITIVFNRPIVPLSTLGYLEGKEVPVEISPPTKGKFRWITPSNLQFIPQERLQRATQYRVKFRGMTSVESLKVPPFEISFFTRKLRYLPYEQWETIYNQPISIYFNQPVDLEKTKTKIKLRDASGKEIPFIAEYKKLEKKNAEEIFGFLNDEIFSGVKELLASIFPSPGAQEDEKIDKSVIQIFNAKDRFGRKKLWDFKSHYQLEINGAYPLEGDIPLEEPKIIRFFVKDIIASFSASSPRTLFASPDFFDPEGKIAIAFYEEIDLRKSEILAPHLKEITYGEKCREDTEGENCQKEEDKSKIYLFFKEEEIQKGEKFEINLKRITNLGGLVLNKEPVFLQVVSYPEFKILTTFPNKGEKDVNLTDIRICSNSPLLIPPREDYKKYIRSNLDYNIVAWGNPLRNDFYFDCPPEAFLTTIWWELMPEKDYSFELELEDVFGQKTNFSLSFTTGKMPYQHLAFSHLQKTYNVTTPEKTKLTFAVKNMEYINLEICKLNAVDFLYYLENRPSWEKPFPKIKCQEIVEDQISLPSKYWVNNYFQVDVKKYFNNPLGHYVLTFYHPEYLWEIWEGGKPIKKMVYEKTYLSVTNLAVAEKKINPETMAYGERMTLTEENLRKIFNLYWVTRISDLSAVEGARIDIFRKEKEELKLLGSYFTDKEGLGKTEVFYNVAGAIVFKDEDSTVIPHWESKIEWAERAFLAKKVYLYTDKPIYQPTQEVFIKGILRIGFDGNYEIPQNKKITLSVFNSRGSEIFKRDLELSDFGTFHTSFFLEKNAPLGTYRICADNASCIEIEVQEYVPAPFEVDLKTDKDEYISKDELNLEISANYYFGVPLEEGEVEYFIASQNYYFDRYKGEYFWFNSGFTNWWDWGGYYYGDRFILRGRTHLSQGKAKITQRLDLEEFFKNKEERKSKIIILDVTVRDSQGRAVSAQKSFILHQGEFYLGIKADNPFLAKNEKTNLRIKSVNVEGEEKKIRNGKLEIFQVEWVFSKRQEAGGGYGYRWEKKRNLIKEMGFETDERGNFVQEIKMEKEGEYEIEVSAKDSRNNLIFSTYYIYVWGENEASIRPTTETELEMEAEKTELKLGEEGKIIIKSPYQQAKALICLERGRIFNCEVKEISGNLFLYRFLTREEHIPNIFLSVTLHSQLPEVKFGKKEFKIDREKKNLNIQVASNKIFYLPGEEVILHILTTDSEGKPTKAEVSLAVVDLSVLALKGNPKKDPLIFFYGGFPLTVETSSNIKNILLELPIPTKGGGGMAEGPESLGKKARGEFRETAFWQAVVITDEEGKAEVRFTLPDNLTTWQTESLGVTKDTKIGVSYLEFTTKKDLMVVPLKPRFIIPGDEFFIGAKVFNQSKERQKITLSFESQTLILRDEKEKTFFLSAGETETIYFKVEAPANIDRGEHKFLLSAKGQLAEDAVWQSIIITPNETYETVASAGYSEENQKREYIFLPEGVIKEKGDLTIKTSATLANFLSDSLQSLFQFPYGCTEQIASKLKALAIIKRGLGLPTMAEKLHLEKIKYGEKEYTPDEFVEIALAEIYNNQREDGGFAFWRGGKSDFYVTLHIVDTLNALLKTGYEINLDVLKKATNYLYQKITTDPLLYISKENVILTSYILFQVPQFQNKENLKSRIREIINDDLFLQEQISNQTLSYLAILTTFDFEEGLKKKVFDVLDNRIKIDARGAFLETNKNFFWYYFEAPIKNTALYLKSQIADKRENPILDKVLRWILNSKKKDGSWGSTQETLAVIDAFVDWLEWKRETESDFILKIFLNKKEMSNFHFQPETILEIKEEKIPLQNLKFNQLNVLKFEKENTNSLKNNFYYDLALRYYLPAENIPPRDEGFSIVRNIYARDDKKNANPLQEAKVGDILRVNLQITVPLSRNYVAIEDFIPAGFEIVNLDLATEEKSLRLQERELKGREIFPNFKEIRNDRVFLFVNYLSPGVYEFDYYIRALIPGKFTHLPAKVFEMYFPENFGRAVGGVFEIK